MLIQPKILLCLLNCKEVTCQTHCLEAPEVITDDEAVEYIRERRGSKSCLKVSEVTGSISPGGDPSITTRRRSVHFDASPAATVEVPASEDEKAQRGCKACCMSSEI